MVNDVDSHNPEDRDEERSFGWWKAILKPIPATIIHQGIQSRGTGYLTPPTESTALPESGFVATRHIFVTFLYY